MSGNISLTTNAQIQIADASATGSPVIYSRNPQLSAIPATNWAAQTINLAASFSIPMSGTGVYSLFYLKNLMPVNSNAILQAAILIGASATTFQLSSNGYVLLGSGSQATPNAIPIVSITLTALSGLYPLLCEYVIASVNAI